jgi:hypothetical protein
MSAWNDVTSYTQSERGQDRVPRTYEIQLGEARLVVTRHIYFPADRWAMRWNDSTSLLVATDIEDAKLEALAAVEKIVSRIRDATRLAMQAHNASSAAK